MVVKKNLRPKRALLGWNHHWLLPQGVRLQRRRSADGSTSQVENAMFFFALKKNTQLSRHEFLEFFLFWKSCICEFSAFVFFLPQKTQLFNVRKTSYWIRSLLERSDFSRLDSKILVKKTRGCHCWNASPLKKSRKKLILHHLFCLERKPQSTRRAPIVDNFQHHHRLYKIADVVTTSAQKWWPLSVKSQQHPKPNKMLGTCGVESIRCCFWETMAG